MAERIAHARHLLWLVTAASLVGTVANIYHARWCFAVWAVTNAMWCVRNVYLREWPQAVLFAVYLCLAVWGWFAWGAL